MLSALEELSGVKSADVSLGEKKATVTFDSSSLAVSGICQTLLVAGYFASPLEMDPQPPRLDHGPHPAKHGTENTNLICYCFGYSRQDIEDDFARNGRSLVMERIMAEKKAGACDCANRNPKGR